MNRPLLLKNLFSIIYLIFYLNANAQTAEKLCNLSDLPENSGLEFIDGKFWTFQDSGNSPELYVIDTATGGILQTVLIDNYPNIDWEDITSDNEFIYIGDFGNNNGTRKNLRILQIKKSRIGVGSKVTISAEPILFSYNDQNNFTPNNNTNFDCEALISIGDSLYLFTKNWGDQKSKVYAVPKVTHTNFILKPLSTIDVQGMITAADYDSASQNVILLGYGGLDFNPFIYELNGVQTNPFTSKFSERTLIKNNIFGWQTEGITFIDSTKVLFSNESTALVSAALYKLELLKPHNASANNLGDKKVRLYPNPTCNQILIESEELIENVKIYNVLGDELIAFEVKAFQLNLDFTEFSIRKGVHKLEIVTSNRRIIGTVIYR